MRTKVEISALTETLSALYDAAATIFQAVGGSPSLLYESLHRQASELLPINAFSICLYSDQQHLFFPYRFVHGNLASPINRPVTNGPIARVIRDGRPYLVLNQQNSDEGTMESTLDNEEWACSLYVPIIVPGRNRVARPLGVLSVHSDLPNAFDQLTILTLNWLADQAALALWHLDNEANFAEKLATADRLASARWNQLLEMTDGFVSLLGEISIDAETVRGLAELENNRELTSAARKLSQLCFRAQTDVSQTPLGLTRRHSSASPYMAEVASLTPRERDVLDLLALGRTNRQIAQELCMSADTVKFHNRRIFQKLNINNRTQAVAVVASLRYGPPLPTRQGG